MYSQTFTGSSAYYFLLFLKFQTEEITYDFEHRFTLSNDHISDSEDSTSNDAFLYINPNKSRTTLATQKMDKFLKKFISSISNLQINAAAKDLILKLSTTLVDQINEFNLDLMEDENGMNPIQVLQVSRQYVCDSIDLVSSSYKRKKNVITNNKYVAPIEIAIGTRWAKRSLMEFL